MALWTKSNGDIAGGSDGTPIDASSCPSCKDCTLPANCTLTFKYDDVNSYQDDSFDIYLTKSDGTRVFVGNLNGVCGSYAEIPDDCDPSTQCCDASCCCAEEDVKTFDYTIDQSFITSTSCGCELTFDMIMVANNGCGTYATFTIIGPYDTGFGGWMGDGSTGYIDISTCCFPQE